MTLARLLALDDELPTPEGETARLEEEYERLVLERWRETASQVALSPGQLGLYYRIKPLIPRALQLALRRLLIRIQGTPTFPAWPHDDSVERLLAEYAALRLRAAGRSSARFRWFWPDGRAAAIILTHDVESLEGLRRVAELADLEEEAGFRSSFNLGAWYEVDEGLVRDLVARGFEIGCHGIRHDRSLFESRASFEQQLPELRALAGRLGAVGFRSPATHRVVDWLHELPFEYDSTIPLSDPFEPIPGGCCSPWPFFLGDVVELPYTLPQDHTAFTLLRRGAQLWIEQAERVERAHGLIQCVSHPDPGYLGDADKRALYREFLTAMGERPALWRTVAREAAGWWRRRDAGGADVPAGTVELADGGGAVFRAPV